MSVWRRCTLALLGFTLLAPALTKGDLASAAPAIVKSGPPFRLDRDALQPGSQSRSALAPWYFGSGGFMATWLNTRSASDQRAFVNFFSGSGISPFPGPTQMGFADGPTSGIPSFSAAPVGFTDATSMVFFSAERRDASPADKRDIFAQRISSGSWTPGGPPASVNATLANAQDRVVATRLSTDNALVAFVSHASAAATFDIRGRVMNESAAGVSTEKALTVNTAGAQIPTSLAALTSGRSVLAYVVRTGAKQEVFVQRLYAAGTRIGAPTLLKITNGTATYGGAGVAALSGGRFIAMWFTAGGGETANLRARIFSPSGVPGAVLNVGPSRVPASGLTVPRIAVTPQGAIIVITDGLSAGTWSIDAWLLTQAAVRQLGPVKLVTGSQRLVGEGLLRLPNGSFVTSYTEGAAASVTHALAQVFRITDCVRC